MNQSVRCAYTNLLVQNESLTAGQTNLHDNAALKASHYTHLPPLYPIVLSDEHRERADELGEAGV